MIGCSEIGDEKEKKLNRLTNPERIVDRRIKSLREPRGGVGVKAVNKEDGAGDRSEMAHRRENREASQ
jgi:hypothetical protein